MSIPKYDELFVSALKLLKSKESLRAKDLEEPLSKEYKLSEEEKNKVYDSGNKFIFIDRISWALSYLNMAELVSKPKRGYFQITKLGLEKLKIENKINDFVSAQIKARNNKKQDKNKKDEIVKLQQDATPTETIQNAFSEIKTKIYDEIIDTIINKTPREFEKLVVNLLQKMGYGGEVKNATKVTQYSNDKGIDGIIKEDILGFGRIYIQAKRYKRDNKIGREELNKFVGALAVAQSSKGVFITTSSFNKNAIEYAEKLNSNTTLVLIDGEQLAKYIYEYSYGMQTEEVIEIKKLDSDFWDTLEDDKQN